MSLFPRTSLRCLVCCCIFLRLFRELVQVFTTPRAVEISQHIGLVLCQTPNRQTDEDFNKQRTFDLLLHVWMCRYAFIVSNVSFPTAVPPVILRLAEPEQRLDTCIEFTVRGYPQPQLRWFHKQKEIIKNDYIRTEMDFYQDYLEGCLTFQNPTHINNGNYTLEASNALGTVTKTVYGHFLENPDEPGEWITTFYRHFILGGKWCAFGSTDSERMGKRPLYKWQ